MHIGTESFSKLYFKHTAVRTESNFLYFGSQVHEMKNLIFDKEEVQTSSGSLVKSIHVFTLILEEKRDVYFRTYETILAILGNIGGLFKFLVSIWSLLIIPY